MSNSSGILFVFCSWASATDGTLQESSSPSAGPSSNPPHPHTAPAPDSQKLSAVPVRVLHMALKYISIRDLNAHFPFFLFPFFLFFTQDSIYTQVKRAVYFIYTHLRSSITIVVYWVRFLANVACFELHIAIVSLMLPSFAKWTRLATERQMAAAGKENGSK